MKQLQTIFFFFLINQCVCVCVYFALYNACADLCMVLEGAQSASSHAVTDAVRTVFLAVAASAVDFVVRGVVQISRVERAFAVGAVEAATVPHLRERISLTKLSL